MLTLAPTNLTKSAIANFNFSLLLFNALLGISVVIAKRALIGIQGYNYSGFTTTLAAIHYLCFATAIQVHQRLKGNLQVLQLAYREEFRLVVLVCLTQILQNLSLMMNPLGLFVVVQSAAIPLGLVVMWNQQRVSGVYCDAVQVSGATMGFGALVFVANCGGVSQIGFIIAVCSIIALSMQCLAQGRIAGQLGLHSLNLDAEIACPACLLMLLVGPQVDFAIHGQEMLQYTFPHLAAWLIVASCVIAMLWGVSCYPSENAIVDLEGTIKLNKGIIVGQQILKIVVILFAGNVMFLEEFPLRKIVGVVLYIVGYYTFCFYMLRDLSAILGYSQGQQLVQEEGKKNFEMEKGQKGNVVVDNFLGLKRIQYLFTRV